MATNSVANMKKHLKASAYACGLLLLITGLAKLYSRFTGSLAFNGGTDPVIGLPISIVATGVSIVEIIMGGCLFKWPLSFSIHAFQVSLFAAFGWYRFLLSTVLGVPFGCYCAGAIFEAASPFGIAAHVLLRFVFWLLLFYSCGLLILRILRGETQNQATTNRLRTFQGSLNGLMKHTPLIGLLVVIAQLSPTTSNGDDLTAKKVSGVLFEVDYGVDLKPKSTNGFQISGLTSGNDFIIECRLFDPEKPGSQPLGGDRGALDCVRVSCESGILRTITEEFWEEGGILRSNVNALVEPYLVPRILNKAVKVAILALAEDLPAKLRTTRYPIMMSKYPPYPVFDVCVEAVEHEGVLRVEAKLRPKRKQPSDLWQLIVSRRKSGDEAMELEVNFRETIPGFPPFEVFGTLYCLETMIPSGFVFRVPIRPFTRVNDFTLLDQMEILKKTDIRRQIWGGVSYIVTNELWAYDSNSAQEAAPLVLRAILTRASTNRTTFVRLAFALGILMLFLLPLVLLKWKRANQLKRR